MSGVFVVTPMMREPSGKPRLFGRALQSAFSLEWSGQLDHFTANGSDDYSRPNETVTRKYQDARDVFLAGKWDYFLSVEYDMIVPPDGLKRLVALDADIAYGLYVFRHGGRRDWSAYTELTVTSGQSLSKQPAEARRLWGSAVNVAGIGQGFTLIKRYVLEAMPFRNWPGVCSDWAMAIDAARAGLTQVADLGCVCGHMTITPSPQVIWPDVNEEKLHRVEFLG